MQQANHNDAVLTLLALLGQCSLQDVDGDEEEGGILQMG
jgi:acyl-CoA-binding protein